MDAIALGPLLLALDRLPGLFAIIVLVILAERFDRRFPGLGRWGWQTLVIAVLAGRLGHALPHVDAYAQAPWTVLYFWQPGYAPWAALIAAMGWTAWRWRRASIPPSDQAAPAESESSSSQAPSSLMGARRRAWLCLIAAAGTAGVTWAVLPTPPQGEPLPTLTFNTLEGKSVQLTDLQHNTPMIVNLWASWCAPCRREMPLLAQYDQRDDVTIVMINQGESLVAIEHYLHNEQLQFRHLLQDRQQQGLATFNTPGLPTTVFYNSQGIQVDRQIGELTPARLAQFLQEYRVTD